LTVIARCAACGEPVSYADEGGCVGTDPAYHFKAECLLEAARRADAQLEGAVEERDRLRIEVARLRGIIERRGTVEALAQLDPRRGQSDQIGESGSSGSTPDP
jgi:hypothetical protein